MLQPGTTIGSYVIDGINPETYIADVLVRVGSPPDGRLDELLPMNWKPLEG